MLQGCWIGSLRRRPWYALERKREEDMPQAAVLLVVERRCSVIRPMPLPVAQRRIEKTERWDPERAIRLVGRQARRACSFDLILGRASGQRVWLEDSAVHPVPAATLLEVCAGGLPSAALARQPMSSLSSSRTTAARLRRSLRKEAPTAFAAAPAPSRPPGAS